MNFVCNPSNQPPAPQNRKKTPPQISHPQSSEVFPTSYKMLFLAKNPINIVHVVLRKNQRFCKNPTNTTTTENRVTSFLPLQEQRQQQHLNNLDHTPPKTGKYLTTYIKRGGKGKKRLITN